MTKSSSAREPSAVEVLLLTVAVFAAHVAMVEHVAGFWHGAALWLDNAQYLRIATIIHAWRFDGGETPLAFWGFPSAIAGLSALTGIRGLTALVAVSSVSSLVVGLLVRRLYGGWVAAAFVVANHEWIVTSVEGGSEPLFMALLFGALLLARDERWHRAALLAALATIVRPVGGLALASLGLTLLARHDYRRLAQVTTLGLTVGVLYAVPVWHLMGTPLASVYAYRADWSGGGPLTYPFAAILQGLLHPDPDTRWTNDVMGIAWLAASFASVAALWSPRGFARRGRHGVDGLFAALYLAFFLVYNYTGVVAGFSRFVLPIVPLLLVAWERWIPRDRRLFWVMAVLTACLASAEVVSLKAIFGFALP